MAQGQKVGAEDSHMRVMLIVVTLLSSSPFLRRRYVIPNWHGASFVQG